MAMALAVQTTGAAASRGQAAQLTMLHGGAADPVHARIATDGLVRRVDKDDLVDLVSGILI